jgi:hypothetical protein
VSSFNSEFTCQNFESLTHLIKPAWTGDLSILLSSILHFNPFKVLFLTLMGILSALVEENILLKTFPE